MTAWNDRVQARLDDQLALLWDGVAGGPDGEALRAALDSSTSGGKRIRPRLTVEVHDGLDGTRHDAVIAAAAAVELLHTAFVVHDDIIDGDDQRRGRPSALGRFRAEAEAVGAGSRGAHAYAVAGALLTGDLALSAALTAFARLDLPPTTGARVLRLATQALATSAAGELGDVRFSLGRAWPGSAEAVELAYRKTAAYSFVLPMQLGAVLADADARVVDLLAESGRCLGIAFQLRDDLAGMLSDPHVTGKDPLADLREGKVTLLVCHARGTDAWEGLSQHWGRPGVTLEDLQVVRRTLEESGTRAHVEGVAAEHLRSGLAYADQAGVGAQAATWFADLVGRSPEVAA